MSVEDAEKVLKGKGLKCTAGRVAIIDLLQRSKKALTPMEIDDAIPGNRLNLVSVYRALDAFSKAHIVHKMPGEDGGFRYALCLCENEGHCHPHFMCRSCGNIRCLKQTTLPHLTIGLPKGYVSESQEVYVKGLCPECVERNK